MKEFRFNRLATSNKIVALENITKLVIKQLEKDGILSTLDDFYINVKEKKIQEGIRNWKFKENGEIIQESIINNKGVLDYGKEQF